MKTRLAVKTIEIGTDELAVLHAIASIINEVGYASGGIDRVVGAVLRASLRPDDLDALLQTFLDHHNARQSRVRRCEGDVELHGSLPKRAAEQDVAPEDKEVAPATPI